MNVKCPNCDAALVYNPQMNWMECNSCGSTFRMEDIKEKTNAEDAGEQPMMAPNRVAQPTQSANGANASSQSESMSCNVYTCTSCGAELLINGVESSTFCAYCGQPTIVFSRVSSELRPKYIIPFCITKDQAINGIRQRLKKGFFIPNEVRNFEIEKVRGIYIPYWLYDMYFYDKRIYKGQVGSGKNRKTKYFFREGECAFKNLTLDASYALNDEISQRLEPYNMVGLREFDPGYMSGFYADRYDMDTAKINSVAVQRASNCFGEEMEKSIKASSISVITSQPAYKIYKTDYVYLPAWFLTFHYQNEKYTILVNGQTGKVVGAVPFSKGKVAAIAAAIFPFITAASIFLTYIVLMSGAKNSGKLVGYMILGALAAYFYGAARYKKLKKQMELTKAKETVKYVKERQDKVS